jgi:UPF0755 protein
MAASASAPRWIVWGALLALAAMGTMAVWTATKWHRVPVPGAPAIEVEIPRGASLRTVARELEAAGIVEDATSFELAVRLFGGSPVVKAGTYSFTPGDGWGSILAKLVSGDTVTLFLTIPEGMPSIMVQERLMAAGRLTGEAAVPAEGSVLPATWAVRPGENRAEVLARMQKGMEETLAELWPRRTPAAAVKTPEEAIILASIVEKETGVPEERRRVAGLYTNRLKAGMKLEADPTVIYSITKGKPLGRRIRQSELDADTGWNTYARPGLPKGPITNPGRESIAAVLDPEVHDYLFMVADGTGGHAFAATYAEHRQNVARWYALRRDKGEM